MAIKRYKPYTPSRRHMTVSAFDEITKSTLTKQLRELENDGWINRQIYQEIPPRVEYTLTELAESFVPILEQMKEWSETHLC